ncbi:MAG: hypothetical protein ABJC83_23290 [Roseobacter sp.]|uniref:hypothetical protein n=2 Tax=Parasphingorhabdus sp. TaxID=2709688 RepID=UPI003277078C
MWQGWLFAAVLLLWAAPALFWRRSARGLVAAWVVAEFYFRISGNQVPVQLYLFLDCAIITFVLLGRKLPTDWAILAIFPVMWTLYFTETGAVQWWALYWLALTQLFLAGPWFLFQKAKLLYDRGPLKAQGIA